MEKRWITFEYKIKGIHDHYEYIEFEIEDKKQREWPELLLKNQCDHL
jgi:hypothetical protein